jgi:drug/metabolite transporter (DMT)-like permease
LEQHTTPEGVDLYRRGILLGAVSSLGYSGANVFLRAVDDCDPVWVSCIKAIPTILVVFPWLVWRYQKVESKFCPPKLVLGLVLLSMASHFLGNVGFQWSLNKIGISLAVPICLGVLIVTGALVDWWFLKDKPSRRTMWSMAILVTAVVVLSTGGKEAFAQLKRTLEDPDSNPYLLALAVGAVIVSGINYGFFGAVIKVVGNRDVSQPAIMTIISVTGFLFLLVISALNGSWEVERNLESEHLLQMTLAGICNAIAFVALVSAIKILSVTRYNLVNASQAALGAITGAVIFHEPVSGWMVGGIVLTVVGLMVMKRNKGPSSKHKIE